MLNAPAVVLLSEGTIHVCLLCHEKKKEGFLSMLSSPSPSSSFYVDSIKLNLTKIRSVLEISQ